MPTIVGRLTGAAFQTELLVMNLLGLVNSLRKWETGWTHQVDTIRSSEHLGGIIKILLCWVVKIRIIIAGVYTITYCANFYSILTWCRERTLLPWIVLSAFDNFLLEFIEFAITLLLWVEKSLSTALLIEYVIARTVPRVPALYYWCIVNVFRADLRENQRRKLIRASLSAHQDLVRNFDIGDHLRFGGVSYSKDYFAKSPRFASLTNVDDLLIHSSFEYDEGQDSYKRSKSLVTFLSIDSVQSDELEDYRILKIFDNYTLTPMEKALKILDLNEDDVNDARVRLGKPVLAGPSKREKVDKIISTVERSIAYILPTRVDRNVSSIAPKNTIEEETIDEIRVNEDVPSEADVIINDVEPDDKTNENREKPETLTKIHSIDENLSREASKESSRDPLSSCICGHKSEEITKTENSESTILRDPLNESHRYEENNNDPSSASDTTDADRFSEGITGNEVNVVEFSNLSKNRDAQTDLSDEATRFLRWSATDEPINLSPLQMNPRQSLSSYQFRVEDISLLTGNSVYPGGNLAHPKGRHYELFRLDDITREPSERWRENSDDTVSVSSMNFAYHTGANFNDDTEIYENNVGAAVNDFSADSSFSSTSMEKSSKNRWRNLAKHNEKSLEILANGEPSTVTIVHFSKTTKADSMTKTDVPFCRLTKRKKRLEKIEEREAREMRALRVYNRLTLLEDKREMEAKKGKTLFPTRANLQTIIRSRDPTHQVAGDSREFSKSSTEEKQKKCANNREKLENTPKRETAARPQTETSKLRAFNVNLDALKTSISLGFSSDSKNHLKLKNIRNSLNQTLTRINREIARESSKSGDPATLKVGDGVLSPSVTKIDELWKGRNAARSKQAENRTVDSRRMGNRTKRENVFPRMVLAPIDNAEIEDDNHAVIEHSTGAVRTRKKRAVSRIHEAFMNADWSYNDGGYDESDESPCDETIDPNRENFLWDIIDETNTITLLQSAFSSNPENASCGFYLGPGSTELYSVSNYFNDVVEEIMKTARLMPRSTAFRHQPTTEIDYGDAYLEEFEMTSISAMEGSSEDTLTDSDAESIDSPPDKVAHLITSERTDKCFKNHSGDHFDVPADRPIDRQHFRDENVIDERDIDWENDRKTRKLKYRDPENIFEILGERELSHLEFWTRELTRLASDDHRDGTFEFARDIRRLTELPGFFVVQTVVDFFRNSIAVSGSEDRNHGTILSENGTAFSPSDEEIVASLPDETEGTFFVDEAKSDSENMGSNNDVNSRGFYFGSADNERLHVADMLNFFSGPAKRLSNDGTNDKTTVSSEIEGEIIPDEIQVYPIINQRSDLPERASNASSIVESSSQELEENTASKVGKIDLTFDSYDSLYSVPANSNDSDNRTSIDGRSSIEEFSRDTINSSEFHDDPSNATLNP